MVLVDDCSRPAQARIGLGIGVGIGLGIGIGVGIGFGGIETGLIAMLQSLVVVVASGNDDHHHRPYHHNHFYPHLDVVGGMMGVKQSLHDVRRRDRGCGMGWWGVGID